MAKIHYEETLSEKTWIINLYSILMFSIVNL